MREERESEEETERAVKREREMRELRREIKMRIYRETDEKREKERHVKREREMKERERERDVRKRDKRCNCRIFSKKIDKICNIFCKSFFLLTEMVFELISLN